jgi:hypothetical protein
MLPEAIITLITGATGTHIGVVSKDGYIYKADYLTSTSGFGGRTPSDVFEQVDLLEVIGIEPLLQYKLTHQIKGVFAGGAVGFILTPGSYSRIKGAGKEIDQLSAMTHKESILFGREELGQIYKVCDASVTAEKNGRDIKSRKILQQFMFIQHIYTGSLKISEALETPTPLPFWIGAGKVGAAFTGGNWASLVAKKEQTPVLEMSGGRGLLYSENGEKGSFLDLCTNMLFVDEQFTKITYDYIDTLTEFFRENNISTEEKLLMKFTGRARNYNCLEFIEELNLALKEFGYPNVSASYISIEEEGALEMQMLENFMNDSNTKSKLENIFNSLSKAPA